MAQVLVALALLLPLVGCMSGGRKHSLPAPSDAASPLTSGDLHARLLDAAELGDGVERHEVDGSAGSLSITAAIPDCDARARYDGRRPYDDVMGSVAKTSADYLHQKELLVERVYSAKPATLAARVDSLFATLTACPRYTQVLTVNGQSTGEYTVTTRKVDVPGPGLRFGYLETQSEESGLPGAASTRKVVAVVLGRVAVILDGTPALVDRALTSAVRKATG
ncbi:hypothetical protein QR77_29845 [Streptomyces sp. 150FB]|nr:hypothetical protein QR77_29845 [Streptomyces sp. 150FB]